MIKCVKPNIKTSTFNGIIKLFYLQLWGFIYLNEEKRKTNIRFVKIRPRNFKCFTLKCSSKMCLYII